MEKKPCTSQVTGALPTGITNYFQLYIWIIEHNRIENIAKANDIQIEWQEGSTKFLFKEQMVTIKAKAFDYVVGHLPSLEEISYIRYFINNRDIQRVGLDADVDNVIKNIFQICLPRFDIYAPKKWALPEERPAKTCFCGAKIHGVTENNRSFYECENGHEQ